MPRVVSHRKGGEKEWEHRASSWRGAWKEVDACGANRKCTAKDGDTLRIFSSEKEAKNFRKNTR